MKKLFIILFLFCFAGSSMLDCLPARRHDHGRARTHLLSAEEAIGRGLGRLLLIGYALFAVSAVAGGTIAAIRTDRKLKKRAEIADYYRFVTEQDKGSVIKSETLQSKTFKPKKRKKIYRKLLSVGVGLVAGLAAGVVGVMAGVAGVVGGGAAVSLLSW